MLSVGDGSLEQDVSPNLVTALQYAREIGTPVLGIVGVVWHLLVSHPRLKARPTKWESVR